MRAPGFANVNALMDAMPGHAQSIEIVRGPGSALYGSNAYGLINFISARLRKTSHVLILQPALMVAMR